MSARDMFSSSRVCFDLKAKTKSDAIDELIEILDGDGKLKNKAEFKAAVLKREEEFSTGIGMGIAIPHGKSSSVVEACIAFGKSEEGIDYESMDGEAAHLFFLIAVPNDSNDIHLRALSEISRKLMHDEIRSKLLKSQSFEELSEVFN